MMENRSFVKANEIPTMPFSEGDVDASLSACSSLSNFVFNVVLLMSSDFQTALPLQWLVRAQYMVSSYANGLYEAGGERLCSYCAAERAVFEVPLRIGQFDFCCKMNFPPFLFLMKASDGHHSELCCAAFCCFPLLFSFSIGYSRFWNQAFWLTMSDVDESVPVVTFTKGKNACWLPLCMTSWLGEMVLLGQMLLNVILFSLLNKGSLI